MSDLKLPGEDDKPKVSFARITIWVIVAVVGLYMVLNGVIGALTKG